MSRVLTILACLAAALTGAAPAAAYWTAGGTGTGTGPTAGMPTGATPTVVLTGRDAKVTWAQNAFAGGTIGSRGGGYTVTRYAENSSTPIVPGSGCAGTRTGTTNPQTCTETNVPYGRWVYRVTPVMRTFTGTQGPSSAAAAVVLPAPVLQTVTAQNPSSGGTNGPIAVTWGTVAGATGYNVYRRLPTGSYSATPLNGAPVNGTTYSDTTGASRTTYAYVVRAISTPPLTTSADSNELSAKVITRPGTPGTATAVSGTGGAINVSWGAATGAEGYNIYRRTSAGSFDYSRPVNGSTPATGTTFRDGTAAPSISYHYVVRSMVTGANGTSVESSSSPESNQLSCSSTYSSVVTADNPLDYFRMDDTSASVAANTTASYRNGTYGGGVSFGQPGAIACDNSTAVTFNGSSGYLGPAADTAAGPAPNTFSIELWFKTSSTQGGKLVGIGTSRTGASPSYDRHLYLTDDGEVAFGVYPNAARTLLSTAGFNDGEWHQAVGVLGPNGQRLYVDGVQVGVDTATTNGQTYDGYLRVGYDNLYGWPGRPSSFYFGGDLDEISTYVAELPAARVAAHYAAGRP